MKRFSGTGTLGAMIYPFQEKKNQHNRRELECSTEFQAMLDNLEDEDCTEESSRNGGKKRRLSLDQVKALEKMFEEDNKLEAEQKVKIAQELGLKPRQVAIWFQNWRARWKTKRLERDYGVLKASYEALKVKFDELVKENEGLVAEVKGLRAELGEHNTKSNHSVQEATLHLESENNISEPRICPKPIERNPNDETPQNANSLEIRDGLCERICNGLLKEENDLSSQLMTIPMPPPSSLIYEGSSSSSMYSSWMDYFHLLESRAKGYQHQFVKVEEQSTLFSTEDYQKYFLS